MAREKTMKATVSIGGVIHPSLLTVSKIKSVRESQEKAKADAARLGDDSLTVDPNLKDFQNVTEDNGNEPVFLLTNGE